VGEKEAIFDLFHRGEEAKKIFIRGTGLGLFIVRDIMRAHGGDCYVRQLNNPTEFVITLPNKE
jgi:signal transduction histidine kinase